MKIEKLLTLSQFVDLIENELDPKSFRGNKNNWPGVYNHIEAIFKYNTFLKQPLKKQMFVNEVESPDMSLYGGFATSEEEDQFEDGLAEWQEAEKKVIFEGWEYHDNAINNNSIDWYVKFDKYIIHHHADNTFTLYISGINNEWTVSALHDLSEATKGELKLKNINI